MILAGLITLLLALAWLANAGLDRSWTVHRYTVAMMGTGAIAIGLQQDWWLLGLWLLLCANALRRPWPMRELSKLTTLLILYELAKIGILYASPILLLTGIVCIGLAHVALWYVNHPYTWQHNHTNMLFVVSTACAMALVVEQSPWWVVSVPVLCWPFLRRPGQAWLWMLAPILGLLAQASLIAAVIVAGVGLVALGQLAWPYRVRADGPDHGRLRIWSIFLILWWKAGWTVRLFGNGFSSWITYADSFSQMLDQKHPDQRSHNEFFVNPHNEYVHILFEHGMIGLALVLGLLASLFWGAWQTHPARVIPALALCATAATSFPWTLPLEICVKGKQGVDYVPFGCMGMVMVTVLVIILLGGQP